jgi:hypothetical protein
VVGTRAWAQTKFAAATDAGSRPRINAVSAPASAARAATWQANTVLPTPDVPNTTHNASGSSPRVKSSSSARPIGYPREAKADSCSAVKSAPTATIGEASLPRPTIRAAVSRPRSG